MELLLILAAGAGVAVACILIAGASAQGRRPELRMQREIDLADGDEEAMVARLMPAAPSPIDREGPVIDLAPIEDGTSEPAAKALPHDRTERAP